MVKAEAEALIDRPVTRVFAFVAEDFVRNYPRWSPEVELMEAVTEGPLQVGWVGRQVRVDKGRRTQSEFRVVAFEHPSRVCFEGLDDPFRIRYRFTPEGARTRVSFDFELDRLNPGAMLFLGTVRRVVQSSAERMLVQLKGLIEDEVTG
ncbi:SRPBCC family protein [Thiorhodococcus minor]|uniref:Polyketide cyclase n=1 Tax=Thiorhodococcus minor TaxID=57489 RepID=A0A6M0K0N0_9GAMM|nr:SRPBCC family protein [Thiorhodococcus minor]NEV62854.1 polyketide cyclase [Thiorhodococcus minor]